MDPRLAWFILLNPLVACALIHLLARKSPGTSAALSVASACFGLLAGLGGTGHVVGLPATSPAHSAGDPPTITFVCFGNSTTGPAWQQVI